MSARPQRSNAGGRSGKAGARTVDPLSDSGRSVHDKPSPRPVVEHTVVVLCQRWQCSRLSSVAHLLWAFLLGNTNHPSGLLRCNKKPS